MFAFASLTIALFPATHEKFQIAWLRKLKLHNNLSNLSLHVSFLSELLTRNSTSSLGPFVITRLEETEILSCFLIQGNSVHIFSTFTRSLIFLYGIYAAVLLWLAYKDIKHTHSIQVRFRYDGDLFDLRRLKSKTKVLALYIREAQYADDVATFSDIPAGLQILLTAYNDLARKMGLCINTTKTETMCIGPEAEFFIDQTKLKNVNSFKYLGSYVTTVQ